MNQSVHAIKKLLDRWLVKPAYIVLVLAILVRAYVSVIESQTKRPLSEGWAIFLNIIIVTGIIVSEEVITSSNAAGVGLLNPQIRDLYHATYEKAIKKHSDNEAQAIAINATRVLRAERRGNTVSACIAAAIGLVYGMVFELSSPTFTWQTIVLAVAGLTAPPFFLYEFSARYKAPVESPRDKATEVSYDATIKALGDAGEAIRAGTQTNEHIRMIQQGLKGNVEAALEALIERKEANISFTVNELVSVLADGDEARTRQIRRVVSAAGRGGKYGVWRESEGKPWHVPAEHLVDLFPQYFQKAA